MSDRNAARTWLNRIALMFPWAILGLASCSNPPHPTEISINPSFVVVIADSTTTFTAVLTSGLPQSGSLTWSVAPASGGTITSRGVYTASGTAGHYTVVATWTPTNGGASAISSDLASVEVLRVPQQDSELNSDMVQASGAIQAYGTIQNAAIVGQPFPSVISMDPNGDVQVRSGFAPPVACRGSSTVCD